MGRVWESSCAHPRCADCRHSRCGNCGTGLSILVESWGARREKEGRGMAAPPEARGCWQEVEVPKCPAQILHRWIPHLNLMMPYLQKRKKELFSTSLLQKQIQGLSYWSKKIIKQLYFGRGPQRYSSTVQRRWFCWPCVSGSHVSANCLHTFLHHVDPWIPRLWSKASRPRQHLRKQQTHTPAVT